MIEGGLRIVKDSGAGTSSMSDRDTIGRGHGHAPSQAFSDLGARAGEGLMVFSRRNLLKAGWAGMAGLSLPALLRGRARAAEAGRPIRGAKRVILLWMAGGPSHIDTWDPKPHRPPAKRGPVGRLSTKLPRRPFPQ